MGIFCYGPRERMNTWLFVQILPVWSVDSGIDRTTKTTEAASV